VRRTDPHLVPVRWTDASAACDRLDQIETQWLAPGRTAAPLLVFLHEGLGSRAMWRDFPQRLCDAAGCRGLVFSRQGYGQSTPRRPDERWPVTFMHTQARAFLPAYFEALDLDTAHDRPWLFGHSDGGSIALLHAAACAERVAGAVVAAPHLFVEDVSVNSIAQTRETYLHTDLRARLARHHADVDSAFWGWNDIWLDPAFRAWNIEAEVASIACPVLAVQGLDDEYGTMAQIDAIARHARGATQLLKLAACGHSPHRDQPQALIAAVTAFMQAHPTTTGDRR
jgi:pimeloyl-ACP methyl ester carboxylesterase